MKKSLVVTLALVFVLGIAGTAFAAANPFVDVPAKHWAYDAVSKLAQAGIVDGYNDGTFRGDKTITRYEMAQIVAKAMTRSDKANAETKALVDKLAVEFNAELQNLGVRVAKLEANQANLKFGGTVDMRYTATDTKGDAASTALGQWRLRMDGTAKVDDKTTLGMRMTTQTDKVGTGANQYAYYKGTFISWGDAAKDSNEKTNNSLAFDRLFLTRQIGVVKTTVGAQMFKLGTTGMLMDNNLNNFDGFTFAGKSGVVNLAAQYGRFMTKVDIMSLEANTTYGKLAYGAGYASMKDKTEGLADKDLRKYLLLNTTYAFDSKLSVGGEWAKNNISRFETDKTTWNAFAVYGDQVLAKEGDNNIKVTYLKAGKNAITKWSAFDFTADTGVATNALTEIKNTNAWVAQYNYAFSKNLTSYLQYASIKDVDNDGEAGTADKGKTWVRVGVTAKF